MFLLLFNMCYALSFLFGLLNSNWTQSCGGRPYTRACSARQHLQQTSRINKAQIAGQNHASHCASATLCARLSTGDFCLIPQNPCLSVCSGNENGITVARDEIAGATLVMVCTEARLLFRVHGLRGAVSGCEAKLSPKTSSRPDFRSAPLAACNRARTLSGSR